MPACHHFEAARLLLVGFSTVWARDRRTRARFERVKSTTSGKSGIKSEHNAVLCEECVTHWGYMVSVLVASMRMPMFTVVMMTASRCLRQI